MFLIPESIKSDAEKAKNLIEWLAGLLKGRKWITILLFLEFVFLAVFSPTSVTWFLGMLSIKLEPPKWYLPSYWAVIAVIFMVAFILTYRSLPVKEHNIT